MKLRHKLFCLILFFSVGTNSMSADVVYDPWNHAENVAQLAKQVQQIQKLVTLVNNQSQLLSMANLNQMKWVIDLVNVHKQSGTLTLLQGQLREYYRYANNANYAMQGVYRQYLNSNLSWDAYVQRENDIASANYGVHTSGFQYASKTLQGLEDQHRKIEELSERTDTSQGTQQLLQTLNKHMNLIATQNSQILGLIAQDRQVTSDENAQALAKKTKRIENSQKASSASQKSKASFNKLTGYEE